VRSALSIIPTLSMGLNSITGLLKNFSGGIAEVGSQILTFAMSPVGIAILAISALASAVYLLWNQFNATIEATRKFDEATKSANTAISSFNEVMGKSASSASGWKTIIDLDNQAITKLTDSLKLQEVELEKYTEGMNGLILGTKGQALVGQGLIGVTKEQITELERLNKTTEANIEIGKAKLAQDTKNLQLEQMYFDVVTVKSEKYQASLSEAAGRFSEMLGSGLKHSTMYYTELAGIIEKFSSAWNMSYEDAFKALSSFTSASIKETDKLKDAFVSVPLTIEEQLVNKAQADIEKFRQCSTGKMANIHQDTSAEWTALVSDVGQLINAGLVGEAQDGIQAFKECATNKAEDMAADIANSMAEMAASGIRSAQEMQKYLILADWQQALLKQAGKPALSEKELNDLLYGNPEEDKKAARDWMRENPAPAMASGGIVTRPTLALLGERGPEAVVPLNGGGGLGGVHIHIDSPLINVQGGIDRATADYAVTQVERMLKSVLVEASSSGALATSKRLRKQSLVT